MANGDAAAAAGLATFAQTQDHGQGYDNDNIRGDELAGHMTDGTHPWSNVTMKPTTFPPTPSNPNTDFTMRSLAITVPSGDVVRGLSVGRTGSPLALDIDGSGFAGFGVSFPRNYGVTTSGGSDVVWLSPDVKTGEIARRTSSRRYKQDIEAAESMDALLDVQPATWHDINDPEGRRYFGAIAEDVHDLGLTHLVTYDGEGRPEALRYDLVGVALIPLVRALTEQVAELTRRLDEKEV